MMICDAGQTAAQDSGASPKQVDLGKLVEALNPGGPNWRGRAEFPAATGAKARVNTGILHVGDTVAEIEIGPTRTARLLERVELASDAHGRRSLEAGILLFARNGEQVEAWPNQPPRVTDRGRLQWCLLDGDAPLCISMENSTTARFTELGGIFREWRAGPPALREEPVTFAPPLTWRLSIKTIDADGVSLQSTVGRDEVRAHDRGFGAIKTNAEVDLSSRYPGLRFQLAPAGATSILVKATK